MKANPAPPSSFVRITTAFYLLLCLGIFVGAFFQPILWVAVAVLVLAGGHCYWFWSPVAYEVNGRELTVCFRGSRKTFPNVLACSEFPAEIRINSSVRLCGNGGVFSISGIYWKPSFGVFRAYLTRTSPDDLVLVQTEKQKIVISPENVPDFLRQAR